MKIKRIAIRAIKPAKYNPRVDLQPGDPEYEKIKRSIKEFGFVEPLVWNEHNGVLIGGHQRLKVLVELGHDDVDVSVVNIKDPLREKALNVALNKISGDWDEEKLDVLFRELSDKGFDVLLTGFSDEEIKKLTEGIAPPDAFDQYDKNIETHYQCPKCKYEWSGQPRPKESEPDGTKKRKATV